MCRKGKRTKLDPDAGEVGKTTKSVHCDNVRPGMGENYMWGVVTMSNYQLLHSKLVVRKNSKMWGYICHLSLSKFFYQKQVSWEPYYLGSRCPLWSGSAGLCWARSAKALNSFNTTLVAMNFPTVRQSWKMALKHTVRKGDIWKHTGEKILEEDFWYVSRNTAKKKDLI